MAEFPGFPTHCSRTPASIGTSHEMSSEMMFRFICVDYDVPYSRHLNWSLCIPDIRCWCKEMPAIFLCLNSSQLTLRSTYTRKRIP
ncbi:unnamed protein product [Nippostrongylus brasiliensis]|uniref:Uncharacterized protein n=1 Tax=Nippostrongylus brasiliensis TaxID=27835 RepID=A0A0N4YUH9_NIPBR|nr:unnamed protein product [Nippostrongylus brasiliensis]